MTLTTEPRETQKRIASVKKWFSESLCDLLNLEPVMAPLFVAPTTGYNDHLNGTERVVSFDTKEYGPGEKLEVVQSLAKWKRDCLGRLGFQPGEGIITDMRAIRRDEDLSPIHSFYVTQWDWEKVIAADQRTLPYLYQTVEAIYSVIKETEAKVAGRFGTAPERLPEKITFVTAQELEDQYPSMTAKEREDAITKKHRAVFIQGIGGSLKSGDQHDGRACDYDDWTLNGDILLWHPVLEKAFEISSMGIRVNAEALKNQAAIRGESEKLTTLDFHKAVMAGDLPLTIGGGIGQCRVVMYFLQAAHIQQVQPTFKNN